MLDTALIKECADPTLKPAIVEQFVAVAGSADPLAVTVKSGGRLILIPKATSVDQAMAIIRQYAGSAIVRVGLTQLPAGIGVTDPSDLQPDLVDACANLRKGTAMFAKILRIVAKWYGNRTSADAFPPMLEDAVYAWKTGEFEGRNVFLASDPGGSLPIEKQVPAAQTEADVSGNPETGNAAGSENNKPQPIGSAEMRIDLSRIGGE
ncbi:TraH family protein [Rhizobium multihospitium]|uniref:TraH_2 protein n=1 Tax=Rhizobium multihospitium TaxID=410764 RepID=A0A1C3XBE2_9HYPH|nr:TraH family protein [Rhizobium multihospitium]SCB49558.1 TraH_2 protein [Rhizobium multihospitium]